MAFNNCMKMVPLMGRRLVSSSTPNLYQARTIFSPWPRSSDIGALIRDMDRQMDRLERQVFRGMPSLFPRASNNLRIDNTLVPHEGGGQYRVAVDLAGFKPEEINLALDDNGRHLTISAKCERQGKDGSRFAHEMSRTITLPESIDTANLTSMLHLDGILAIEAPFKDQPQQQPQQPLSIPINRSGNAAGEQQRQLEQESNKTESSN